MTAAAATTDGTDPLVQYEELRAHVVVGTPTSHAGLVLLLRQGVAGWMARRKAGVAAVRRAASPRAPTSLVSNEIHAGLVRIIAGMAMAGKQEVHP